MEHTLCNGSPSPRQIQLEKRLNRLGRRLEQLEAINQRFSLYRMGVFLAGLAATVLTATFMDGPAVWWVLGVALAIFVIVVYFHRRLDGWRLRFATWRSLRASQLARLRLEWAGLPVPPATPAPDERMPLDIDLDLTGAHSLHQLLDLAVSLEGSRRLAGWLTGEAPDVAEIQHRQALVGELSGLPRFRDRLLLNLRLVSKEPLEGGRLLHWLQVPAEPARLRRLFWIGLPLAAVNAVLFGLSTLRDFPPVWLVTFSLYMLFYLGNRLGEILEAVMVMDSEMDKFRTLLDHLETYPLPAGSRVAELCRPFRTPGQLPSVQLKRLKGITAAVGLRMNPIVGIGINMVFPWDFLFAYQAARLQKQMTPVLPIWLETWYELEALISLANYAWLNPEYTFPRVELAHDAHEGPVFSAQGLGHPMIPAERRVCNDFHIPSLGQVALITGSNMAGKSTFIKTVGIALCLAYAGGPVCARRLHTLPFRLHSCIRITDSITDGFSYFYAEVKCLRRLLEALRSEHPLPVLYLIDEIFRGTNNRERLLGSRAYIQALAGARGCGLIATHDLELARLAEATPAIDNFHFRDAVLDGRLVFDYQIRPGPSPTTNALKIMALEGLPVSTD